MKLRILSTALLVLLLSGCSLGRSLEAAEEAVENRVDAVEDVVEDAFRSAAMPAPSNPSGLSQEQAEAIALEHAGFTADQVTRLRTEYEIDDGIARFEVTFRQGRWEYDYEINAETGAILSYDRDD